jgi:hypothetical protein
MKYNLDYFMRRADSFQVFTNLPKSSDRHLGQSVFNHWLEFSRFMPSFLTSAASLMKDPRMSFSLVQIVWEEMGEGDEQMIHADLFMKAGQKVELNISKTDTSFLDTLKLKGNESQYYILGLAFGLEVIANENIAYLYKCLSWNEKSATVLKSDYFFQTHFINEDNHIDLNFKNFSKFCLDSEPEFIRGFDHALEFWLVFWKLACSTNNLEFSEAAL